MKIAIAQINPLIGDLLGNKQLILNAYIEALNQQADLLLTPELSLWGYPPKDLLLRPILLKKQAKVLDKLSDEIALTKSDVPVLVGIAEPTPDDQLPSLFNSIAIVQKSGWKVITRKQLLPTYDVFDEKRYFRSSSSGNTLKLKVKGKTWNLGITICEDLWVDEKIQGQRLAGPDPIAALASQNIDVLVNLSASPFSQSKDALRLKLAKSAADRLSCPVIYVNQVGGNDELVFDGCSFAINENSDTTLKLSCCLEAFAVLDLKNKERKIIEVSQDPTEKLFRVLVLGVRDYARKCGFDRALLGLSGGIDSALVAVIASAALGGKNLTALLMPSPWSSDGSILDSQNLADRLEICAIQVPITTLMQSYEDVLKVPLGKCPEGLTAENLQSRIRGTLLMALANQEGHLLLSTGNKSELAVGYCTLYGDMNGGLSVIGDLYKTTVYQLCEWLDSPLSNKARKELGLPNTNELVGQLIRKKPPSAELSPNQLDSDSLPEYSLLDPILKSLIEKNMTPEELIENGSEAALVHRIQMLIKKAEFKRRQSPPLLKVSNQAFGSGWRIPIAAV